MPPDPPRAFLASQSASNLFCRKKKKTLEKNVEMMPPPSSKIFRCATAYSSRRYVRLPKLIDELVVPYIQILQLF